MNCVAIEGRCVKWACTDQVLVCTLLPNNRMFYLSVFKRSCREMLGLSKFKAFAEYKLLVNIMMKFVFVGVENIVGKGANASY